MCVLRVSRAPATPPEQPDYLVRDLPALSNRGRRPSPWPTDRGPEMGGCPSARLLGDLHRDAATATARLGAARLSSARRFERVRRAASRTAARLRAADRGLRAADPQAGRGGAAT